MPFLSQLPVLRRLVLAALILGLMTGMAGPTLAFDGPVGKRPFAILINGVKVGHLFLNFRHEGKVLVVEDEIYIAPRELWHNLADNALDVLRMGIGLDKQLSERYVLRCREVWRDGALAEVTTDIDDYGKPVEVDLDATPSGLMVNGPAGRLPAPPGLVPSTLWHIEMTKAPAVLDLYPFASYPFGGEALGASGTDGIFSCPARNADQLLSNFVTTYVYEFNDENAPPSQDAFGGLLTFPLGAYHSSELQYLFKGVDVFGLPVSLSHKQKQLSDAMVSYWTQFAKTGNPNSSGEPVWSPYSSSSDQFQSFIPPTPVVESNFAAEHQCSTFWDTF